MPRLTPEMEQKILELYSKYLNYTDTANELGLDERTVSKVVDQDRARKEKATAAANTNPTPPQPENTERDLSELQSEVDMSAIYKTLYTELNDGKTPSQIIAIHGFDPDFVEPEYVRYQRGRDTEPIDLQKKLLAYFDAASTHALMHYHQLFEKKGYLTNAEILELIEAAIEAQSLIDVTNILEDPYYPAPAGWIKIKDNYCKQVYGIAKKTDELGAAIIEAFKQRKHLTCLRNELTGKSPSGS